MATRRSRKKGSGGGFKDKVASNSRRQKTQASQYGYLNLPRGVAMFKETAGKRASFDIIPYPVSEMFHLDRDEDGGIALPGELWYKRPFRRHSGVGGADETVICPTTIGKKCPICEYRQRRFKEGADKKETGALRASLRNLYIVVPKGSKEYDEEPHIWDISQFCFQDMLNDEIEENEENGIFPDLEEGLTVRARFSKEFIDANEFAKISRIDFEERDKGYGEDILNEIPNLDDVLVVMEYDALEALFFELGDDEAPNSKTQDEPDEPDEPEENGDGSFDNEGKDSQEKEIEKEKPSLSRKEKPSSSRSAKKEDRCPYGHKFAVDCDEKKDCDECDEWEDCIEEKESNGDVPL